MTGGQGFCNGLFSGAYRQVREPLQPQHARMKRVRRHPQICPEASDVLEGNDVPPRLGNGVIRQNPFQVVPRPGVVADKVPGYADHAFTKQPIARVRRTVDGGENPRINGGE